MKAQISHADLIRLTKLLGQSPVNDMTSKLGFESRPEALKPTHPEVFPPKDNLKPDPPPDPKDKQEPPDNKPQAPTRYWYLAAHQSLSQEKAAAHIGIGRGTGTTTRPKVPTLLTLADAKHLLTSTLQRRTPSHVIDTLQAVIKIAKSEMLDPLPYRQHRRLPDRLLLLIDGSARLTPAYPELQQFSRAADSILGGSRLRIHILVSPPTTDGRLMLDDRQELLDYLHQNEALIYVGDQGAFGKTPQRDAECWLAFEHRLRRTRVPQFTLLIARPQQAAQTLVDKLMAATVRCEGPHPDRIRHLRLALGHGGLAEELAVWNHPNQIQPGQIADVDPSWLDKWGRRYQAMGQNERSAIEGSLRCWRLSLPPDTAAMEQLKGASLGLEVIEDPEGIAALFRKSSNTSGFKRYIACRKTLIAHLLQAAEADKDLLCAVSPLRLAVADETPPRSNQQPLYIKQHGEQLHYGFEQIAAPLAIIASPVLDYTGRKINQAGVVSASTVAYRLEGLDQRYEFKQMLRPHWAQRIWRNREGLFAAHEDGAVFQMMEASEERSLSFWQLTNNKWTWASDAGIDGYGLWVELKIKDVPFRLRWIAAGTFTMGSPQDEPERGGDETQHRVILSQGYWLAETACTQALWQAVTGENPSHFKESPHNPVEQISWDQCQQFIGQLNQQLDGWLKLRLPTEAEWEYACRAGTDTAFSWGNELTTDQANYDGNYPYHNGSKGEYRQQTVAVNSFIPNPWGLYQMHGNVYEWCADWMGVYGSETVTNPTGPAGGRYRVLRGGGWNGSGRHLRSAYRGAYIPGLSYDYFGLRLAGGRDPQAGSLQAVSTDGLQRSEKQEGDQGLQAEEV